MQRCEATPTISLNDSLMLIPGQRLCLTWTRCASLGQLWTALEGWGYLIIPAARLVLYKPPHWKVHCGISGILWKYVLLGSGRWNCRPKELQRPFLDNTKASKKKSEQEGLHLPSWLRDKVPKSRCAPHSLTALALALALALEVAGIDPKLFEEELRPKTGLSPPRPAPPRPGSGRTRLCQGRALVLCRTASTRLPAWDS